MIFKKTPEDLMKYIFSAAKKNDLEKFRHLCDPYGENDSDSGSFCYFQMMPQVGRKEMIERIENGRIMGDAIIEDDKASIEVAIGKSSNELVKVNMVRRNGNWFISGL